MTTTSMSVFWLKPDDLIIKAKRTANNTMWVNMSWSDGQIDFFIETAADFHSLCKRFGITEERTLAEEPIT